MAQVRTPFIPSFPPAFSSIPVTVSEFSSSIPTPNPPATQESEPHSQQPKSNQKSTPESDNMSSSRDGPVPEPTPQQQLPSPAEEPVPEQQPESLPALSHQEQDEQLRRTLVQKVTPYAEELICLELVQSNEFREDKDLWRGPNGPSPRFYAFVKDTTEQVPDMSREHLSKLYTMLRKVTWLADLTGECWPDPHIPHYMSEEWGYEVTSYDKKMRSVFSFFILLHLGTEWHAGIEEELLYPAWKKRTVVQEEVRASWARLGDGPAETDTFFWENWDQENNVRFFYLNSHIPFLVHAMLHSWANRVQGHAPVPCYNDEELGASRRSLKFAWNGNLLSHHGTHEYCANKMMLAVLKTHHLTLSWWFSLIKAIHRDDDGTRDKMLVRYFTWDESTTGPRELPFRWRD